MSARLIVLLLAVLTALAACGEDGRAEAAPARVPDELVPDRMLDGALGVFENTAKSTREALATTDESTLVSDTRIWEIRRGDRLVGTLQISTVLPKVDLVDEDIRDDLVAQVILGQRSRIRIGDVEVFTTTSNDKTTFLWFGSDLLEVVQTKDRELDPEALVTDLIEFQTAQDAWNPLPELLEFAE